MFDVVTKNNVRIFFLIILIVLLSAIILPQFQEARKTPISDIDVCKNRLSKLADLFHMYNSEFDKYPPLDGGKYGDNWGEYLLNFKIDGEGWLSESKYKNMSVSKKILNCPNGNYLWANVRNEIFFPEDRVRDDHLSILPLVGDRPGNHGKDLNVLFKDGIVHTIQNDHYIYKTAYGERGAFRSAEK